MDKNISKLSLTEVQAVVGGVKTAASTSINATAMYQPATQAIQPVRYETLLAKR